MPRYIDADTLNAAIEKWFDGVCVYDVSPSEAVNDFQSIVDEQPTVSPDEVRGVGEWKKTDAFPHRVYCSNCFKTIVPNEEYAFWCEGIMPRNYCPNCGAKMEGEDG